MDYARKLRGLTGCCVLLVFAIVITLGSPVVADEREPQQIDFEKTKVVPGLIDGTYILIVAGTKPYQAMSVELVPVTYVRQPEYWGIQIISKLPDGPVATVTGPYQVVLVLNSAMGTKGIEVMGREKSKKIDLPLKLK